MEREKPKCNECGSTNLYARINTKELVCRRCSNVQKIEKIDERRLKK